MGDERESVEPAKKISAFGIWLRVSLTGIILALTAYTISQASQGFDLLAVLKKQQVMPLMGFVALFCFVTVLRSIRFAVIVRSLIDIPFLKIVINYPYLFFVSGITPFRAGDLYKVYYLRSEKPESDHILKKSIYCMVFERLLDLGFLALMLLVILRSPLQTLFQEWSAGKNGMLILGSALLIISVTLVNFFGRRDGVSLFVKIRKTLMSASWSVVLIAWAMTILIWSLLALAYVSVIHSVFETHSITSIQTGLGYVRAAFESVLSVNLMNFISATPANLGTFEAAIVGVLSQYNVSYDVGIIAGATIHLANLSVTIVLGVLSLLVKSRYFKNVNSPVSDNSLDKDKL